MAHSKQEARVGRRSARAPFGLIIAVLLAILAFLSALASQAQAENRSPNGSGIFTLSLSEVLDIRVDSSPLRDNALSGIYTLDCHELIQLRARPEAWREVFVPAAQPSSNIPLLIDGEYFGSLPTPKDLALLTREYGSRLIRIEIFVGERAWWWANGESDFVVNIVTRKVSSGAFKSPGSIKEERRL